MPIADPDVLRLERALDDRLPRPRLIGRAPATLLSAAERWSAAVWSAAERLGPAPPAAGAIERGLRLAARPVFVCGVHRSGTTLVRDLLDGHPALAVLPSEGSFFTTARPHLDRLPPDERPAFMGREWVRRLANPINQPPYWLLGRSTADDAPYVRFARALLGWWPVVRDRLGDNLPIWPLAAVTLAYLVWRDSDVPPAVVRWVEKTPTNEQHLEHLTADCPFAKVIHVVRDPLDVFASRKVLEERSSGSLRHPGRILNDLAMSYRLAAARATPDRYLVVRYEDLADERGPTLDRVAAFLEIERLPILDRPTVAGLATVPNTSFPETGSWWCERCGGTGPVPRASLPRGSPVPRATAASPGRTRRESAPTPRRRSTVRIVEAQPRAVLPSGNVHKGQVG